MVFNRSLAPSAALWSFLKSLARPSNLLPSARVLGDGPGVFPQLEMRANRLFATHTAFFFLFPFLPSPPAPWPCAPMSNGCLRLVVAIFCALSLTNDCTNQMSCTHDCSRWKRRQPSASPSPSWRFLHLLISQRGGEVARNEAEAEWGRWRLHPDVLFLALPFALFFALYC